MSDEGAPKTSAKGGPELKLKWRLISGFIAAIVCSVLFSQSVSAFFYPGPREATNDLGGVRWLLYMVSFIAVAVGAISIPMKGKLSLVLGSTGGTIALLLGAFLTIVGSVKLSVGDTVSSSGMTHNYLYAPSMLPLGGCLLVAGIAFVATSLYRKSKHGW